MRAFVLYTSDLPDRPVALHVQEGDEILASAQLTVPAARELRSALDAVIERADSVAREDRLRLVPSPASTTTCWKAGCNQPAVTFELWPGETQPSALCSQHASTSLAYGTFEQPTVISNIDGLDAALRETGPEPLGRLTRPMGLPLTAEDVRHFSGCSASGERLPSRFPTDSECDSKALFGDPDDEGRCWRAFWYPQIGGYRNAAAVMVWRGSTCFDVVVYSDGEFPLVEGEEGKPYIWHCCDPLQFVRFGMDVCRVQSPPDPTPTRSWKETHARSRAFVYRTVLDQIMLTGAYSIVSASAFWPPKDASPCDGAWSLVRAVYLGALDACAELYARMAGPNPKQTSVEAAVLDFSVRLEQAVVTLGQGKNPSL